MHRKKGLCRNSQQFVNKKFFFFLFIQYNCIVPYGTTIRLGNFIIFIYFKIKNNWNKNLNQVIKYFGEKFLGIFVTFYHMSDYDLHFKRTGLYLDLFWIILGLY